MLMWICLISIPPYQRNFNKMYLLGTKKKLRISIRDNSTYLIGILCDIPLHFSLDCSRDFLKTISMYYPRNRESSLNSSNESSAMSQDIFRSLSLILFKDFYEIFHKECLSRHNQKKKSRKQRITNWIVSGILGKTNYEVLRDFFKFNSKILSPGIPLLISRKFLFELDRKSNPLLEE